MAVLCNRAGHYIFALWFLLLLSFFPHLISAITGWMSAILAHMVSETCCTRLTQNTGRKKNSPSRHHCIYLAISSQLRHVSTIRKKLVKQQYLPHNPTCPYSMVNFGPLAAEIGLPVWGTLAHFNGFRVLAALLHGTLVVGITQTLRH